MHMGKQVTQLKRDKHPKRKEYLVTPQNVTLTRNVTAFDAECNINPKCNNFFNAKCNNSFNRKCNNAKCNNFFNRCLPHFNCYTVRKQVLVLWKILLWLNLGEHSLAWESSGSVTVHNVPKVWFHKLNACTNCLETRSPLWDCLHLINKTMKKAGKCTRPIGFHAKTRHGCAILTFFTYRWIDSFYLKNNTWFPMVTIITKSNLKR